MKSTEENGNQFLKQVSKLFEDLASGQKPVSPRITCTRLRRLREIRCELVDTSDSNLSIVSQNDLEATVAQLNSARSKNESFAAWVLRNRQARQQLSDKQSQSANSKDDNRAVSSPNAFSNFSLPVLQKVASSLSTPLNTLKWLAAHYRAEVRQAVAANLNADEEIMAILAADCDDEVRIVLTGNIGLSRDLLLVLCDDPSPLVSEKAKNILYSQSKSATANNQYQKSVEDPIVDPNPTCETNAIVKTNQFPQISSENDICESPFRLKDNNKDKAESEVIEKEFLQVVAEKSTTPPRRLAELAIHSDKLIRCMVAANPNATPEILWQLAKDDSIDVRRKLLSNYNCPEDIINYLMRK